MRRNQGIWLAGAALAALLFCGCGGILAENVNEDGNTERILVGTAGKWSYYDRNPTKKDETSIMLKKESTF